MLPAPRHPSFDQLYQELRSLPPGQTGEIVNGSLVVSPRPAFPHASTAVEIAGELRMRFRRKPGSSGPPSGWWIVPEPEVHLVLPEQTHVVSPDIAGWVRERMPEPPDAAFVTLPPDWVCEVLSPSTALYDKKDKARVYHQSGVRWMWLVDPRVRSLETYRREGEFWVRLGVWSTEEAAILEPFDFPLDLRHWWDGGPA